MRCKKCGTKLKKNDEICPNCGAKKDFDRQEPLEKYEHQTLLNGCSYLSFALSFIPFHIIVIFLSIISGFVALFLLQRNSGFKKIKNDKLLYIFSLSGIFLSIFWAILIYSEILV